MLQAEAYHNDARSTKQKMLTRLHKHYEKEFMVYSNSTLEI